MAETFTTTVFLGGKNATGLLIPPAVMAALGPRKTPGVRVLLNGHSWRSTVQSYEGGSVLTLSAENRAAAAVQAGDLVQVTIELDQEPRTVEVPADLQAALADVPGAAAVFAALAYSRRKEHVRQVEDAKTPETRARRIAAVVAAVSGSAS